MPGKVSVVINTLNEEKNISKAVESVKWADEIVVCDMHSEDGTVEVAKKLGAKIVHHKRLNYVEPARNFAISKTSNDWILVLDPDEEVTLDLANRLQEMARKLKTADYIEIPRKNLIFGKWMKASMWWPDYNIRFFKKGSVEWTNEIHRPPKTKGQGLKLEAEEKLAIIHYHYSSTSQFIGRLNRYTDVQAKELVKSGYKFNWEDILLKPLGEFLSRFFANRGFGDGLHGLSLSLLQAFSYLIMYLKVWEIEKFKVQDISVDEVKEISKKGGEEINYWIKNAKLSKNPYKRFFQKVGNKLT